MSDEDEGADIDELVNLYMYMYIYMYIVRANIMTTHATQTPHVYTCIVHVHGYYDLSYYRKYRKLDKNQLHLLMVLSLMEFLLRNLVLHLHNSWRSGLLSLRKGRDLPEEEELIL